MIEIPKNIKEIINELKNEKEQISLEIKYMQKTYDKLFKYQLYLENLVNKGDENGTKKNN